MTRHDPENQDFEKSLEYEDAQLEAQFEKENHAIYNYLLNYRLEQAVNFLMYTDASVSEVAENVGFKNSKSFKRSIRGDGC